MTVRSAGILLYRLRSASPPSSAPHPAEAPQLEVWIAHMGGPFWARKDAQGWSIPKGEYPAGEDPLAAAHREFAEEIGTPAPAADYHRLGDFRQPSGKIITVFTAESDFQPERIVSNSFTLEWPKGSGTISSFPEVDRAEWTAEPEARSRLVKGQLPVLDALLRHLGLGPAARDWPGVGNAHDKT
jgi:predicted NUDIX family NTP pyrophosphohydrolase